MAGDDPVTCLWELNPASGEERLVADPRALGADEENLPPEERARRERVRETAAGIVAYATDAGATMAVFALSGQVYTVPLGVPAPAARRSLPGRPRSIPGSTRRARWSATSTTARCASSTWRRARTRWSRRRRA